MYLDKSHSQGVECYFCHAPIRHHTDAAAPTWNSSASLAGHCHLVVASRRLRTSPPQPSNFMVARCGMCPFKNEVYQHPEYQYVYPTEFRKVPLLRLARGRRIAPKAPFEFMYSHHPDDGPFFSPLLPTQTWLKLHVLVSPYELYYAE